MVKYKMKIATYNIWDSQAGMPQRFWQIVKEIVALEADIICLQEVGCIEMHKRLATLCHFEYSHYQSQMGIAVLSKYPIL